MGKIIAIILAIFVVFGGIAGCSMIKSVDAGYVGVKVNKMGYEKGVDTKVVTTGWHFLTPNETIFPFPTFTQNKTWSGDERFTFQSEGMVISSDIGISYSIRADKVADIFQKYRKGITEITDIYIRNMVRDALSAETSKMKVAQVYGEGREDLIRRVEDRVRAQVEATGINVERIYWVGALDLPPEVVASISAKVEAGQKTDQRTQEVEQSKAEAQKVREEAQGRADAILTEATAQAEANRLINASLTPELISYKAMEKWNGETPKITGAGAIPMIGDSILK